MKITQPTLSSQGAGPPSPTKPTQALTLHPNFHLQLPISKEFLGPIFDPLDLIRASKITRLSEVNMMDEMG